MRIILVLALLSICGTSFADPCVIIEKQGSGYRVSSYFDSDGTPKVSTYKTAGELAKVSPLIAKSITGFSKDSERIIIYFNSDETVNRIECHVLSSSKNESLSSMTIKGDVLGSTPKTDISTLKTDVKSK